MNINDKIHGFTVTGSEYIPEAIGTMYYLTHDQSGASLIYLDRDDTNMTFSIAFRTPPSDDTGVFHIIEHSVLCGSRKFPVKEPFVELLKGSLNTFLNALTYEDRTVYPVASRCEKDFLNLTDIYLDAVFHPKILENENIFLQEGWHYEENDDGELSVSGVVYNEMCGAYASPDELGSMELRRALFPNTPYRYDSGGAPDAIPTLTYERLCYAHKTYYHPSNSMIFLDGRVNLDKTLSLIASYLNEYKRQDINVVYEKQAPVSSPDVVVEFEPSGEPLAKLLVGYVFSSPDRRCEDYALTILDSALTATNDSALKQRILDTGLCEDVMMYISHTCQTQITLEVFGIKPERVSEIREKINEIIRDIAREGISRDRLRSTLSGSEFKLREGDFSSLPKGVAYALAAYSLWNYGYSPAEALTYEDTVKFAAEKIDSGYYEKLLLSATVDNPHSAAVIMLPQIGYAENQAKMRRESLKKIRSAMDNGELAKIREKAKALSDWQKSPDTDEALATLPNLKLSDLTKRSTKRKTKLDTVDGVPVLSHGIASCGVAYITAAFSADDLTSDELFDMSILSLLLKNLKTDKYSVNELQDKIKSNLGSLTFSAQTYPASDGTGDAKLVFLVSASALERNVSVLPSLLSEILLHTDFSDIGTIEKYIIQTRSAMEEQLTSDSLSFAISRTSSSVTLAGAINEIMSGYTAYKKILSVSKNLSEYASELPLRLSSLLSRIITRERLTLSFADKADEALVGEIISSLPNKKGCAERTLGKREKACEAISIPARVSYATSGALSREACDFLGTMRVVRSILSYEYLWNAVRVQGGAYGAGFIVRKSGELGFYSYRDPSPAASLKCYLGAPEYLRALAKGGEDLTKFIIGAVGEYDILTTPRTEAAQAFYDYMSGWTPEHEERLYNGMIKTDKNALLLAADIIERAFCECSVCVIGDAGSISTVNPPLKKLN